MTLSDITSLIIGIIVIVLLVIIFFGTYVINKRTPVPKGCEDLIDLSKCESCNNSLCQYKKHSQDEKKVDD